MPRLCARFNVTARLRLLTVLLFLLLSLAGYSVLLRSDSVPYSPHSDVVAYHLAAKEVLHRSLEQGLGIPYWRSDQLSGTPAFGSPNALYTNPLHLAFLVANPAHSIGLTFAIELLFGALGCYLTGRALGLGRWSCVFLGVAGLFAFKLILAVYAGWLGPLAGISTVPFLFASAFWLARRPGPGPALALTASGILCLHAGQLQIPSYAGGFAAAYLFGVAVSRWRRGERAYARRLSLWALAASVLAIASSLYLLLPMLGEAPLVSRSQASSEFLQSGHRLGLRHLLTLFWPEALGTPLDGSYLGGEIWEDNAYVGLLPLLLAGTGAYLAWRRPTTQFLITGFLLSLLFALDTPLQRLTYSLPIVSLFRSPARMLFLTAFFGIVLAGVGFDAFIERLRGRWTRLSHVVPAILVLLQASEGVVYARRYLDAKPLSYFQPSTPSARLLARDLSLFRVAPVGRFALAYGSAAGHGLQLITGYEPYNLRRYQQYMDLLQFGKIRRGDAVVWTDLMQVRRWDLLDGLNVKYLLSSEPLPLPAERFELLERFQHESVFVFYRGMRQTDVFVYRSRTVRPRAYFADKMLVVPDSSSAQAELAIRSTEGLAIVETLDNSTPITPTPFAPSADDGLSVVRSGDGILDVSYQCGSECFVVVSEVWHPGWRAVVDDQPVRLYPTNLSLMGAWLPAGQHRLSLTFRPLHLHAALAISLIAFAVFAAAACLHGWRRRFRRGRDRQLS